MSDPAQGLALRIILFLTGLVLLLIILTIGVRRRSTGWIVFSSIGLVLIVISVWMGSWKAYQCKFVLPSEIRIAGRVTDGHSYSNDYLVLLYRENVEVANDVTHTGKFEEEKEEQKTDGHFELVIPNQDQLTRCSMLANFKQDSFGYQVLGLGKKTIYLKNKYSDLMPGVHFPINRNENDGKKTYTLVVLPKSIKNYPKGDMDSYHTYLLDPDGNIAVNIPIKTYVMSGDSAIVTPTGYFAQPLQSTNTNSGITYPVSSEVKDAWVVDDSIRTVPGTEIPDDEITDIDNCTHLEPQNVSVSGRIIYMDEVQFLGYPFPYYDLGRVAAEASDSLDFMQGKLVTEEANIPQVVPAKTRMKYQIYWKEQWNTGMIDVSLGQNPIQLPFRARVVTYGRIQAYPVDCPQN